jgi:hypothetical protein
VEDLRHSHEGSPPEKFYIPYGSWLEETIMAATTQQSRVDALIRIVGLVTLFFGAALVYFSYANVTVSGIAPEIIVVNSALGILLVVVGLIAVLAKFK